MKIQELAIVFIIIILPISLILAEYTQFQIKTLNTQSLYDSKLTAATYDAIKAFQLNTNNSTTSDIANSKMRDLEASVVSFRNSITSAFELTGYTEDDLNNYIPALVYTLYDGFYIYSPYENTHDESGNRVDDGEKEAIYGLKPYISYSCRYKKSGIDVVITYALDNYITVQGTINGKYVNKSGYLIDGIDYNEGTDKLYYNGVEIKEEALKETLGGSVYPYFRYNGTKYYLKENEIVYISNGTLKTQFSRERDLEMFEKWSYLIEHNNFAKQYYKEAAEFTDWFKNETDLDTLTYADARDEVIDENGNTSITKVWPGNTKKIFDFNSTTDASNNIENELSNFNQHRLAVIRHKIETNLAIAISNYNYYSGVTNVFQMPELKEDEWEQITHNIALISFLQGLPIGGKLYNGYSIVTNSESKEVVLEDNIYILGSDGAYHRIGDIGFENGTVNVDAGIYGEERSAGRLNLDFKRNMIMNTDGLETFYYYPLKRFDASYNSIVMQNEVTTYDDIYRYVNSTGNEKLKIAFYTALGRERAGKYNTNVIVDTGSTSPGS